MNCNNYFDMTDQGDSFETWQGLRGPYYTPHVAADGVLSWTNTGNLPNPAPVDISGPPGSGVELRGPVATVYDLPVTAPASELWQVGTQAPYNGYFFNGTAWANLGPVAAGATFTPAVSSAGVISWTNDGGLPNPESVNIKGPQGAAGATGADGVSPEVTIAQISGGHSVTITDADHPQGQQFDVMDGQTGATGPQGPQGPAVPLATSTPLMDGTASAGSGTSAAREDHVHPHDTTKQNTLTFDAKPTANSSNPVTSGGIYSNTTPSKVGYLDYSAGNLSFHLPASCRCLAVCLDSTADRNGLYAFCTSGAGMATCAKLSSTGPNITNGQNKVTFDFSFGTLTFLLFVPQGSGVDINEIYAVTN